MARRAPSVSAYRIAPTTPASARASRVWAGVLSMAGLVVCCNRCVSMCHIYAKSVVDAYNTQSRAFGDAMFDETVLIAVPTFSSVLIDDDVDAIVIATDGACRSHGTSLTRHNRHLGLHDI
jgi:hypothetical protein